MRTIKLDKINKNALIDYGFKLDNNIYYLSKNIFNDKFKVKIKIDDNLESVVIDNNAGVEYILVDVEDAVGSFVGTIKEEYQSLLDDIIKKCTINEKYQYKQTRDVIKYIKKTYHNIPEYLWKNDNLTGAIRNSINNKWYGLIMVIPASKLGLDSNDLIEVINVRYQKDLTDEVVNNKSIFKAWHMNKKSWITIVLNGELANEIVYSLIDNSYNLSSKSSR